MCLRGCTTIPSPSPISRYTASEAYTAYTAGEAYTASEAYTCSQITYYGGVHVPCAAACIDYILLRCITEPEGRCMGVVPPVVHIQCIATL